MAKAASALEAFGSAASTAKFALEFGLQDYFVVDWPQQGPRPHNFDVARRTLAMVAPIAASLAYSCRQAQEAIDQPDEYDWSMTNVEQLTQRKASLEMEHSSLMTAALALKDDPFANVAIPDAAVRNDDDRLRLPQRRRISIPSLSYWVGVAGIAVADAMSHNWAGNGTIALDAFGLRLTALEGELHVHYVATFANYQVPYPYSENSYSGQEGSKVPPPNGQGLLTGIKMWLSGDRARFFNICYQLRFPGAKYSEIAKNGETVSYGGSLGGVSWNPHEEARSGRIGLPDGVRVYLELKR